MFVGFLVKEGIHSVALEHPTGCNCRVCRAANGDREAFIEIAAEVLIRIDAERPPEF